MRVADATDSSKESDSAVGANIFGSGNERAGGDEEQDVKLYTISIRC